MGAGASVVVNIPERLLQSVPESIPDLFVQFEQTTTSAQDQMLITSIDVELKQAGLKWHDLANLLRFQIVAHKRATMAGFIKASQAHPNRHRLSTWENEFLDDIGRRKKLLSEKQMSCLQSIHDSLSMSDDEWMAFANYGGCKVKSHDGYHIGEVH